MNRAQKAKIDHLASYLSVMDGPALAGVADLVNTLASIPKTAASQPPRVQFSSPHPADLKEIARLVGNRIGGPYGNTSPRFCVTITGHVALALLKACLPWLDDRHAAAAVSVMGWREPAPGVKLSPQKVEAIRRRLETAKYGDGKKIAAEFGVGPGLVSAIKRGRAWAGNDQSRKARRSKR